MCAYKEWQVEGERKRDWETDNLIQSIFSWMNYPPKIYIMCFIIFIEQFYVSMGLFF